MCVICMYANRVPAQTLGKADRCIVDQRQVVRNDTKAVLRRSGPWRKGWCPWQTQRCYCAEFKASDLMAQSSLGWGSPLSMCR
uniref:Uncharacterized protein n=1 Tax=Anguilla anguilla TaxID=7936 RepID=A0A0E9RDU4_ANGAN